MLLAGQVETALNQRHCLTTIAHTRCMKAWIFIITRDVNNLTGDGRVVTERAMFLQFNSALIIRIQDTPK
jgi:hypothetical protein